MSGLKTSYLTTYLLLSILFSSAHAGEKMNVLLLMADDLNTWILEKPERYAGKVIAPNLHKLSKSGLLFRQAYTAAPFCVPSRTAIHSGVSPHKSGVYHNQTDIKASKALKTATSMAMSFKKAGYTTASYGKITHGWKQDGEFDDREGHKRPPSPPKPLTSIGKGEQDWGPAIIPEAELGDTKSADRAIALLQKDHDKPFFIACGTFTPHMPWYVPQKYFDMFPLDTVTVPKLNKNDFDDIPPLGDQVVEKKRNFTNSVLQAGLHKEAVQAYLASIAYIDHQLGRVIKALDESPYKDNTIVVFMSDHGFHIAEKDHWQKGTLWEEATNSMLMFRAPGVTQAGSVTNRCVSLQDLYPTMMELCHIPKPSHVDGKSLLPLLKNSQAAWESTAISYLYDQYASIRTEQFRYIRYKEGQEELYDRKKDLHEWNNQAKNPEYTSVIKNLNAKLPSFEEMAPQLIRGKK